MVVSSRRAAAAADLVAEVVLVEVLDQRKTEGRNRVNAAAQQTNAEGACARVAEGRSIRSSTRVLVRDALLSPR